MSVRTVLLVVSLLGLVPLAVPAGAEEQLGIETQFAGEIVASTEDVTEPDPEDDSDAGALQLAGKCAYVGVTTPEGQIRFAFTGETASYSTVPESAQSVGTRATCTLISPRQPQVPDSPPTLTLITDIRLGGSVAATVPALTDPWPLRPVRICVSGDAQFGPIPAQKTLKRACTTEAVTPSARTPSAR